MSTKKVAVEGLGEVTLYKRRGARHVRLSVAAGNQVRITIPIWAPYKVGMDFLQTKLEWVQSQLKPVNLLIDGQQIGKAHRLKFVTSTSKTITTRVYNTEIMVGLPKGMPYDNSIAQGKAHKACVRALKGQAERLLPQRLDALAKQHGFSYNSVTIKQLKGRWGSCSQHQDIVLNCFLMKLPWELIDYVLVHELVHTRIMAHGPVFWAEMAKYVPKLTAIRKLIRTYQPTL